MSSKLNQIYRRYKQDLRRLQKSVTEVRTKLEALEEAGAIDSEEEQPALPFVDAQPEEGHGERGNLTRSAMAIVNTLPEGKRLRRSEVGKELVAHGYVPKGEHFNVTLFKTLIRLKKAGKIGGEKVGAVWQFFAIK